MDDPEQKNSVFEVVLRNDIMKSVYHVFSTLNWLDAIACSWK